MKHDVEFFVILFVFNILTLWCSYHSSRTLLLLLFDECLLFFLVTRNNLLNFVLKLNDRTRDLGADSEKEVRNNKHHDEGEYGKWHNKPLHDIISYGLINSVNFLTDQILWNYEHKSILFDLARALILVVGYLRELHLEIITNEHVLLKLQSVLVLDCDGTNSDWLIWKHGHLFKVILIIKLLDVLREFIHHSLFHKDVSYSKILSNCRV